MSQTMIATLARTSARYQRDAKMRELITSVIFWQSLDTLEEPYRALFKTVFDTSNGVIATKETIFHAQGGGQPSDHGTITSEGIPPLKFEVQLVRKLPSGLILHAGKYITSNVQAVNETSVPVFRNFEPVLLRIDHETREFHSRLHTAGHLVGLAVRQLAGTIGVFPEVKANHAPGLSFVEFAGQIHGEHKAAIQDVVNDMVDTNRLVHVRWWNAQEVKEGCTAVPDAMNLQLDDGLMRVIEVEGLGAYPCGGTHLHTTGDIGKILIRKMSRQKANTKVSYEIVPSKLE